MSLLVAAVAALHTQSAARLSAQLLRATYDLHRFALYEALHLPLPLSPGSEKALGEALSIYLKRSLPPEQPTGSDAAFFQHPK